jgi:hypothetical protein
MIMLNADYLSMLFSLPDEILRWCAEYTSGWCVVAAYILFSGLERRYPFQNWPCGALRISYTVNVGLFVVNNIVLAVLSLPALLSLAEYYARRNLNLNRPGFAGDSLI